MVTEFFREIKKAAENPLVRGFADAGVELVKERVELARKEVGTIVNNPFSKPSQKNPVLEIDLTSKERKEKMELAAVTLALRDLTPEGLITNELMIAGIFLHPDKLKVYKSREDREGLIRLYSKRSFSSLSSENKRMVLEILAGL